MKSIVVLGGGESGVGAAILAKAKGFEVFVSDSSLMMEKFRQDLREHSIPFEEGGHTYDKILAASEVIKSPGIPEKTDIIQKLREKNIPVISEIDFASRFTKAKIVGITGSNGKTTTTLLTHHLFTKAGINAALSGNIGNSFAKQVLDDEFDWYILEISSFQLDDSYEFHPDIAILTNITPDHLDRYQYNFQNYTDAKFRILQKQTAADFFCYFEDNAPIPAELVKRSIPSQKLPVSLKNKAASGFATDTDLVLTFKEQSYTFPLSEIPLKGQHNALNAMFALLAGLAAGISYEKLREGLKDFEGAAHRLEQVAHYQEVTYINDSKATNVDSVFYALGSYDKPIVWIAGGIDKGNDYGQIIDLVQQKVTALICLGTDNTPLTSYFNGKIPVIRQTQTMTEAVAWGHELSQPGGTVLLSPACSSFDLFKNYEDRGNQFREAVLKLTGMLPQNNSGQE